jgi:hypothetical protein
VTLDDELGGVRVGFVKIDVEGSELGVLRGARRTLAQQPILALELHNFLFADRIGTMREILHILTPLNYRYWLQPLGNGDVHEIQQDFYLAEVALWDNPHLYCVPR